MLKDWSVNIKLDHMAKCLSWGQYIEAKVGKDIKYQY